MRMQRIFVKLKSFSHDLVSVWLIMSGNQGMGARCPGNVCGREKKGGAIFLPGRMFYNSTCTLSTEMEYWSLWLPWGRLLFPRNLVTVTQALLQTFHLTPSSSLNWTSLKLIIDMNYDLSINGFTCWFVRPTPCVLTVEHALLMESNVNQKMVLLVSIVLWKRINSQNI